VTSYSGISVEARRCDDNNKVSFGEVKVYPERLKQQLPFDCK
jgi:hypothetical protein